MELKIGMYVRYRHLSNTKISKIFRIDESDEDVFVALDNDDGTLESFIIKASYNLIDLIEIGDYVNGLRINSITEVDENHDVRLVWNLTTYGDDDIAFSNEEIKSIVTKEQFNSVKYEVE